MLRLYVQTLDLDRGQLDARGSRRTHARCARKRDGGRGRSLESALNGKRGSISTYGHGRDHARKSREGVVVVEHSVVDGTLHQLRDHEEVVSHNLAGKQIDPWREREPDKVNKDAAHKVVPWGGLGEGGLIKVARAPWALRTHRSRDTLGPLRA